jgi:hypothetical protein
MKTWFWIWFLATQEWKEMDRTIKILNDYPYECLIWKNKIGEGNNELFSSQFY